MTMTTETNVPGELVERPFLNVTWQKGLPTEVGVNGCQVADVLQIATEKLQAYQSGPLACEENAEALAALETASLAMAARKRRRKEQGVLNTMDAHESERTEDLDEDFSATGA